MRNNYAKSDTQKHKIFAEQMQKLCTLKEQTHQIQQFNKIIDLFDLSDDFFIKANNNIDKYPKTLEILE
jgi:hypothetical protein